MKAEFCFSVNRLRVVRYATGVLWLIFLAGCNNPQEANDSNFRRAINAKLAKMSVCIWKEEVANRVALGPTSSQDEGMSLTADSIFIPDDPSNRDMLLAYQAMARAGVFKVETSTRIFNKWSGSNPYLSHVIHVPFQVSRFSLATNAKVLHGMSVSNICYAKVQVDRIIRYSIPGPVPVVGGGKFTQVVFSYKYQDVQPWAYDPSVQKLWPEIRDRLEQKKKVAEMDLLLTNKGWHWTDF